MPPRDWTLRIRDVVESMDKIARHVSGMTFEDFRADEKTIDAVLRNLIIIGEATRHVPSEVQAGAPEIPWADMRAMRNFVSHEYYRVTLEVIWQTVQEDLPSARPQLQALLDAQSPDL